VVATQASLLKKEGSEVLGGTGWEGKGKTKEEIVQETRSLIIYSKSATDR